MFFDRSFRIVQYIVNKEHGNTHIKSRKINNENKNKMRIKEMNEMLALLGNKIVFYLIGCYALRMVDLV